MDFDRIVEQKIREAREEGKFDNLRGKGRPLNLDDNPFEDPAWQTANHLLKENGFRPGWLEDDVELRTRWTQARQMLTRTRDWRAAQLKALGARDDAAALQQRALVADEWSRAVARFRDSVTEINKGIARLNLIVPGVRFQRRKLDVEAELQKLDEAG